MAWWRMGLLMALLGGVGWALGRSLMTKMGDAPAVSAVELVAVGLPNWQLVESQELAAQPLQRLQRVVAGERVTKAIPVFATYPVAAGRRDHYSQNGRSLQVEQRYMVNTQGDVAQFWAAHPAATFDPTVTTIQREQANTGTYNLSTQQGRAYLNSCINPRGPSSVTRQQFIATHLRHDLSPVQIWRWLVNQAEIPDRRCLWLHMWIPVQTSPEAAYQELEQAWSAGYTGWRDRLDHRPN
jgi:cyanosortase A-associated protein